MFLKILDKHYITLFASIKQCVQTEYVNNLLDNMCSQYKLYFHLQTSGEWAIKSVKCLTTKSDINVLAICVKTLSHFTNSVSFGPFVHIAQNIPSQTISQSIAHSSFHTFSACFRGPR